MSDPHDPDVPADTETRPGGAADGPQETPASNVADPFHGPGWDGSASLTGSKAAGSSAGGSAASGDGSGAGTRRRRRRVSRRRLRRRRRVGLTMLLVGAVIVLGGLWLIITGLLARGQLDTARSEISTLHAQIADGDLRGARSTAVAITEHAHRAREYTSGPAWALAAALPAGGQPFGTIREITYQTDVLGQTVLPSVIDATHELNPATLRSANGTIDLARIAAIAPRLHRADLSLRSATTSIAAQPTHTWLGFVDSARAQFLTELDPLSKTIQSADLAARVVPAMLGQHGTQRYFIAFQNDAEARGTGGLPGAFAIARVTDGRFSFERFESDGTLNGVSAAVRFGPNFQADFGNSTPYSTYVDSNESPNFPYAAQIWLSMWQARTGEKLDGALALDPQALSYLLAVTGPAGLPDGTSVTAQNVVALTQRDVYARFASVTSRGNAERKQFLLDVARAVSQKVLSNGGDATALVKAAGQAGVERRLLVYSTNPSIEADLQRTSLSGAIPVTSQPFAGLVINNDGGNKLDYYLERSLTWQRTGCGATRQVTVTIRLTNAAPTGLPAYVVERNDHPDYPTKPGANLETVFYYATRGAFLNSMTLDGKRQKFVFSNTELGHPIFGLSVEMPRGATRTMVLHLSEPAGTAAPIVLRQPLVQPLQVRVENQNCG